MNLIIPAYCLLLITVPAHIISLYKCWNYKKEERDIPVNPFHGSDIYSESTIPKDYESKGVPVYPRLIKYE